MESFSAKELASQRAEELLHVIRALVDEIHPNRPSNKHINLDSTFEEELGLDSLSRVELISRVEAAFHLALPEQTFAQAQTPRDLLRALLEKSTHTSTLPASDISVKALDETTDEPDRAQTLLDVLQWHVTQHPDRPHIRFYRDDGKDEAITYKELQEGALKVAGTLQEHGLAHAGCVAIMLPSSKEYFFSFFGILMAGGIPVPIYPPSRPSQLEDHMRRHARILQNCRAAMLITLSEAKHVAALLKSYAPDLEQIITVEELKADTSHTQLPVLKGGDIAFLQYTSGSTGNPKGVVLTHANLLANIRAMGHVVEVTSKDVFVSWLPLYHDMGLIGAWLGSLYFAALFVVMPPLGFLSRPQRWLWAIHRYRGTLSASPNFGYEYCLHRLDDADLKGLDLSSWRAAFNGAEAVSPQTLENFSRRFAPFGFDEKAMMPVYGLAESSVGLAFPPLRRGTLADRIDREVFTRSAEAKKAQEHTKNPLRFVSSGLPLPGHQIRVVDPAGHELGERHEGRLQFQGPSSTSGYYRNAEKTQQLFKEEWLDTGDLAYIANGELYITGRIKDIIIRAGRNIYPDELEKAIGEIPGIRKGCVAVFGSSDAKTATERLVILAESRSEEPEEREKLRTEVNALALDLTGTPPDEIVLAPPHSVLKTSSGKIRRAASRELFEKGLIGKSGHSVASQLFHLTLKSIIPRLRRSADAAGSFLFAAYSWSVFCIITSVVWLSLVLLPKLSMRWAVMRRCARLLAQWTRTPLKVIGLENLPADTGACVLVANHASYIDSFALIAALPGHFRFVTKAELSERFITRAPLQNLHAEFVERFEIEKSVEDSDRLGNTLKAGHTLFFFPEGGFTRVPGLKPFHMGAFRLAAQSGTAVVPIAIRGTRSILRADSWFPRRGSVTIEIAPPIDPKQIAATDDADSWQTALLLREKSRDFILSHCGEPDLEHEHSRQ